MSSYSLSILGDDESELADEVTLSLLVDSQPNTPQVSMVSVWYQYGIGLESL